MENILIKINKIYSIRNIIDKNNSKEIYLIHIIMDGESILQQLKTIFKEITFKEFKVDYYMTTFDNVYISIYKTYNEYIELSNMIFHRDNHIIIILNPPDNSKELSKNIIYFNFLNNDSITKLINSVNYAFDCIKKRNIKYKIYYDHHVIKYNDYQIDNFIKKTIFNIKFNYYDTNFIKNNNDNDNDNCYFIYFIDNDNNIINILKTKHKKHKIIIIIIQDNDPIINESSEEYIIIYDRNIPKANEILHETLNDKINKIFKIEQTKYCQ